MAGSVMVIAGGAQNAGSGGVDVSGPASAGGAPVIAGSGNETGGASIASQSSGGTSSARQIAGGAGQGGAEVADGGPPPRRADLEHAFESVSLDPGEELLGTCQSWTLNNDQPLNVNRVVETNGGNFHHSNWIWVPDTLYTGPDGTFKCADRGFDQIAAGALGGVFFAQSTQARGDTQAFPDGVAFTMPAHARIIGDVHLLNTTDAPAQTSLRFELYTLPDSDVRVPLQPMAFTNLSLDIAPQTETRARMQCATPQPDFDIYYVLPHFHSLGQGLSIDVAGGPMDGSNIFQSMGAIGNSLGKTFDPPIAIKGSTGLAVTCDYRNPGTSTVKYGEGDQEMCVVLIYSDGKKAGGETFGNLTTNDSGGVHQTDALCIAVGAS